MKKIALITGATSGFGKASAIKFAENNFDLIITGRREKRLKKLKNYLEDKFKSNILILNFDIRDKILTEKKIINIPKKWQKINVLVNNAGLAKGLTEINNAEIDDWESMIDTNIKGLLYVSKVVIDLMIKNKKGHIINIGSTAGKEVYEKGGIYCATKYAVDAISKPMRIDLLKYGIKVTQICPGAAETEFSKIRFNNDRSKEKEIYNGYKPLIAKDIADIIYYCTTLPKNVCINDLVVTCLNQANSFYISKKILL